MQQIIECVPNFSEGRRGEVVDAIVAAITSVAGVVLLDRESDASHNRSVVTFVGDAGAVAEAAFRGCAKAAELIDLDAHRGEHPRMGATDVVPFIPIRGATTADCVAIARQLGERVGRELAIPVYLYEDAATREGNRNLADVRRGEYEGIRREIETNPDRAPDFGPRALAKAGAVAIGARFPLIAYNVNLGTHDLQIAKAIAKAVRFSSGGLRYVKALGIDLAERGLVQVSMNMTDYTQTPLFRAFDMVKREAERYGVPVVESEIVGLVPQAALTAAAAQYLQLPHFSAEQVLEVRLQSALAQAEAAQSRATFIDALAAPLPAPGGGSASAHAGAMAAALVMMVAGLTLTKKSYAAVHLAMQSIRDEAGALKDALSAAVDEDAQAYGAVLAAYKLPKESLERAPDIERAMMGAAAVPMRVAEQSNRVRALARDVLEHGLKTAQSDSTVAGYMAEAAIKGALRNVQENLGAITDAAFVAEYRERVERVEALM
ncbi:MAG: glutamate formimidoyltransferase [Chloroflexi bacterium]|nr:glutamate formimidoyltransferase [Chloroflexota bacterium]